LNQAECDMQNLTLYGDELRLNLLYKCLFAQLSISDRVHPSGVIISSYLSYPFAYVPASLALVQPSSIFCGYLSVSGGLLIFPEPLLLELRSTNR
jgi:hypothetical protein